MSSTTFVDQVTPVPASWLNDVNTATYTSSSVPSLTALTSVNGGQLAGLRNRIINGDMRIDQRNSGGAIAITADGNYTVDRSFSVATGANLTGNRTLAGLAGFTFATQFIGAASNTGAQIGQRIEASGIQDFVTGKTITVSAYVYSSSAFTPTWQWVTATSTDSGYATIGASGSFAAVNAATWTRVSATFTAPANTTNGAEFDILLGATVAGVAKLVTGMQVELGSVATPFEQRPYGMELALCQRYGELVGTLRYEGYGSGGNTFTAFKPFKVTKRTNSILTGQTIGFNTNCSIGTLTADVLEVTAPITLTVTGAVVAQVINTFASAEL